MLDTTIAAAHHSPTSHCSPLPLSPHQLLNLCHRFLLRHLEPSSRWTLCLCLQRLHPLHLNRCAASEGGSLWVTKEGVDRFWMWPILENLKPPPSLLIFRPVGGKYFWWAPATIWHYLYLPFSFITRNSSKTDGYYWQLLSVENTNEFSVGKIK